MEQVQPTEKRRGRPLKFETVKALQAAIAKWMDARKAEGLPPTVTSLAYALDVDRSTLIDYGDGKYDSIDPDYSHTVKKAKQLCEVYAEDKLYTGQQAAGVIFSLKNNYGWRDKSEVDQNMSGNVGLTVETVNYAQRDDSPQNAD